MSSTLIACPTCAELVRDNDTRCPHCDGALSCGSAARRRAAAVLMGLSLSACVAQPAYGVPDTETQGATTESSTTEGTGTEGTTDTDTSGSGSASEGSSTTTGTDSDTDTDTSGTTETSTTAEPAYGVPATTTGGAAPDDDSAR
jgi:hypothetical protein